MPSWTSVLNGYHKRPEDYIIEAFDRPAFLSHFHVSPEHCGLVIEVTHIPASAPQSKITRGFTVMMFYRRRNQCRGYEERKEKRLRAFTATQYQNERNAARRGSSDVTTSTAKMDTLPTTHIRVLWSVVPANFKHLASSLCRNFPTRDFRHSIVRKGQDSVLKKG